LDLANLEIVKNLKGSYIFIFLGIKSRNNISNEISLKAANSEKPIVEKK